MQTLYSPGVTHTKSYVGKQAFVEGQSSDTGENSFFALTWSDLFLKFIHFASKKRITSIFLSFGSLDNLYVVVLSESYNRASFNSWALGDPVICICQNVRVFLGSRSIVYIRRIRRTEGLGPSKHL